VPGRSAEGQPAALPRSASLTFTDPHLLQERIRAADVEVTVTGRGAYLAELQHIDLHRLWMQRNLQSLPFVARAQMHDARRPILFLADFDQAAVTNNGLTVAPGELVAYAPGAEHYMRTEAANHWASMSLSPEELAAAGRVLLGRDLGTLRSTQVLRPPQAMMTRLMRLHESVGRLAARSPSTLAHPEVARAAEQALIEAMVACLDGGTVVQDDERPGRLRVAVLRRLEDAFAANRGRVLYLPELCAAAGVPARTLEAYCREYLGMGPRRYLWLRRMHLVRRALIAADRRHMSVTGIANDHGFTELGRFAVHYRTLFGEVPSATLQRPWDAAAPVHFSGTMAVPA
jgi:AraC-like DNA-binding protein